MTDRHKVLEDDLKKKAILENALQLNILKLDVKKKKLKKLETEIALQKEQIEEITKKLIRKTNKTLIDKLYTELLASIGEYLISVIK